MDIMHNVLALAQTHTGAFEVPSLGKCGRQRKKKMAGKLRLVLIINSNCTKEKMKLQLEKEH